MAHISDENNHPEVVRLSGEQALQNAAGCAFNGQLLLATQSMPIKPLEL